MKRVVILHGTDGSPESNWFRWLEAVLKKRGLEVWLPVLPNAGQPSLREWTDSVRDHTPSPLDQDTLLVGHSSGAILALILAQESSRPIGAVLGVSVFCDNSLGWDANNKLFDVAFDFEAIKKHARKLLFIHSNNDPYVLLPKAQYVADKCAGELFVIPGQGHFNLEQNPSYATFPKLVELLDERQML